MQNAQRLIELRDDAIRHEVITKLASEGGLIRVAEMTSVDFNSLAPETQATFFEQTVLPFFRTVTHVDVL